MRSMPPFSSCTRRHGDNPLHHIYANGMSGPAPGTMMPRERDGGRQRNKYNRGMDRTEAQDDYLQRLRQWRNPAAPDMTMRFVQDQFKKQVKRPHEQLGQLSEAWERLVPPPIAQHTALESLSRGVLRVRVAQSATLYKLDRMLRSGLERQLRQHAPTTLRRVKLRIGVLR